MVSFGKLTKGGSLLIVNEMIINGCSFAKNIVIARYLSKSDFGVAAILATVMSFLELGTKMSFGQQIVSDPRGESKEFVATAHSVQILASGVSIALLLILSKPLAMLLGMREYAWAFRLLAAIPLCVAFTSLEAWTYLRRLEYGRSVSIEIVPQVLTTLAVWPLAAHFKDFRALLCVLIGKAFLSAIMSHVVVSRGYRIRIGREFLRPILRYAIPLMLSSYMMIGILQGDRLVIAGAYTLSELGGYAAAAMLALMPAYTIIKVVSGLGLPLISHVQGDKAELSRRSMLLAQLHGLGACLFAVGMASLGERATVLFFGARYFGVGTLLAWLACANAIRIVRNTPVVVSMALGDTKLQTISNGVRLVATVGIVPIVWLKLPLVAVAIVSVCAEWAALIVAVRDMRSKHSIDLMCCHTCALLCVLFTVGPQFMQHQFASYSTWTVDCTAAFCGLGLVFVVWYFAFGELRCMARKSYDSLRSRIVIASTPESVR